ncbi:MAG: MFS transporter [Chlamydiota bacterium]
MLSLSRQHQLVRITIFANILTWYEFSLYIQFAPLFGTLFFPHATPAASLIHVFFIFALGFLARPIGTLVFSHIGDKLGRRMALISSVMLMTIPSFFISIIPTYAYIGLAAPLLMACMRLTQEFSTGGEYVGTMCYLYEISNKSLRGYMGSWTFFGSQLGLILGIFEFLLLDAFVPAAYLSDFGWRISFFLGGLLGLIAWQLRRHLTETPLFETERTEGKLPKRPVLESLQIHKMGIVKAFFLSAVTSAGWYLIFVFSPAYTTQFLGFSRTDQLLMNGAILLLSTLFLPLFGFLADLGHKKVLFISSVIGTIFVSYPLYLSLLSSSPKTFILLEIIATLLLTIQFALIPSILCDLFPLRVRYSCVGIGYNSCNLVFGGLAPIVALSLLEKNGQMLLPAFLLIGTALLSLAAFLTVKEKEL